MKVVKCKECEFFVSENEERSQSFGDCVCNPPVVLSKDNSAFPRVFSEWRCGKGVKRGVAGR